MDILFVICNTEFRYFEFNDLVTDFWLIREFSNRGNRISIVTPSGLILKNETAYAKCYGVYEKAGDIFRDNLSVVKQVDEFDVVMFRPDPPVDTDFIAATYVLDFVKKAKIINDIGALRGFNEKLHTVLFSELMPEYIVTADKQEIEDFLSRNEEIILKPLNKCFGAGVMYLRKGDYNTVNIINLVTNQCQTLVMVQRYLPEAKNGDKRILTLGDEVLGYGVKKFPTEDDFKFNTHNDNYVKGEIVTDRERELYKPVAEKLNSLGIYMSGLDVINDKIIEVNITSPCYFIREINKAFGIKIEAQICDKLTEHFSSMLCNPK